jgi:hypothetical protein
MTTPRKARARRLASTAGVLGVVMLLVAACITNAGAFTLTVQNGSTFALFNAEGEPTMSFAYSDTKACADTIDNDLDRRTDFGNDPQCDSAADNNERLDGVQTAGAPTLPMEIKAVGDVLFDPTDLVFPPAEVCVDLGLLGGIVCIGTTVRGTGAAQTGHIDTGTHVITLTVPLLVDIDAVVGLPGFGADCAIGPISPTFTATDYDTTTGAATLVANDVPVPAVSNCGSLYNGFVNDLAGLPGTADVSFRSSILNGEGAPITFKDPE